MHPEREVLVDSPRRLAFLAILGWVFVGMFAFLLYLRGLGDTDAPLWLLWAGLLFFGLAAVPFSLMLVIPRLRMRLELAPDGFETSFGGWRRVERDWADVEGFALYAAGGQRFVGYRLREGVGPVTRRASRALTGVDDGLPSTYGMTPEALLALMQARWAAARRRPSGLSSTG